MVKLLRVLVILVLVLSIASLVLGIILFPKREELKGRTQKLEKTVMDLAKTIESEQAEDLAKQDLAMMDLEPQRKDLMTYYGIDTATGKKVPYEPGPGTMRTVLTNLLEKAALQHDRLNETRQDLTKTREELAKTKDELTKTQNELANTKQELEKTKGDLADARDKIAKQTEQITALQSEKDALDSKVSELQATMSKLSDTIKDRDREIIGLKRKLDDARGGKFSVGPDVAGKPIDPPLPGFKGKIVFVNPEWNFVVLSMVENSKLAPTVQLNVQRADDPGTFVAKIKVTEVRPAEKLAVASIMSEWQQLPIKEGDNVFY